MEKPNRKFRHRETGETITVIYVDDVNSLNAFDGNILKDAGGACCLRLAVKPGKCLNFTKDRALLTFLTDQAPELDANDVVILIGPQHHNNEFVLRHELAHYANGDMHLESGRNQLSNEGIIEHYVVEADADARALRQAGVTSRFARVGAVAKNLSAIGADPLTLVARSLLQLVR